MAEGELTPFEGIIVSKQIDNVKSGKNAGKLYVRLLVKNPQGELQMAAFDPKITEGIEEGDGIAGKYSVSKKGYKNLEQASRADLGDNQKTLKETKGTATVAEAPKAETSDLDKLTDACFEGAKQAFQRAFPGMDPMQHIDAIGTLATAYFKFRSWVGRIE